jgi:GxxExxY protein
MPHEPISPEDERLAYDAIGAAIEVHRVLGPGFLEKIYERALLHELALRGIPVTAQQEIFVPYKGIRIPGQQLDLLIGDRVILELKAVAEVSPVHEAQLLSYLKACNLRLGILINFNCRTLKDGIQRMVR